MASAHVDSGNDGDQIGIVQLDDEIFSNITGDENFEGNENDGMVENSDILIINHDDYNAENNSSDEIEAGSGPVDYDDSFLRNKSANSDKSVEIRNASANHNESDVGENENAIETGAVEVEQGVEAIESYVELNQTLKDPGQEETFNIDDTNPPSLPGSAVSRISVRSAERDDPVSSTTTPRSCRETSSPQSTRSQLQSAKSHRSNRSASAQSQTGSSKNQPVSTSQTPLQGSARSQMSRHSMNETVGSATSRKSAVSSAKSREMSAPSMSGSARSRRSSAEGSVKSRTTVITNENATDIANAEEGGNDIGIYDGTVDVNDIGDADDTVPSDEINAEVDAESENKNDMENDEYHEPDIEFENTIEASADDNETTKEVTHISFANFYCVANRNMSTP